ncbi:MAG: hypothetical protein F6K10_11600 [Moorea sp. SIO2B7]|nr:hypothetical protein [Moorena sp. SIO2B7]
MKLFLFVNKYTIGRLFKNFFTWFILLGVIFVLPLILDKMIADPNWTKTYIVNSENILGILFACNYQKLSILTKGKPHI